MAMERAAQNLVRLTGKISRMGSLKYTPAGAPLREAVLAVSQVAFDKESVGYIELVFFGPVAEQEPKGLRVGVSLAVQGRLWNRVYRNRRGERLSETKVLVESFGRIE